MVSVPLSSVYLSLSSSQHSRARRRINTRHTMRLRKSLSVVELLLRVDLGLGSKSIL